MKQPRAALIALALSLALAACVQEPRYAPQSGAAGNQPDQHAQNPPARFLGWPNANTPVAISCAVPGPKPRPILVPAGKNPTDFCPATAITYHLPVTKDAAPPGDWASLQMEQDNLARMQLDAIAASKLQNKTPGQQTPEQKTSGQQPP